jgi:LysM repeat protein
MVPLRIDVCEERPRFQSSHARPRLVLKDLGQDTAPEPAPPPAVRRSFFSRIESILLSAAVVAVLFFFLSSSVLSLIHTVQQSYAPPTQPTLMMIAKTVKPGDTLAKLAGRYGDPNAYLPVREEQIARANHLSGAFPLVPGQRLRIPVTNPTVIAQIQKQSRALLASR